MRTSRLLIAISIFWISITTATAQSGRRSNTPATPTTPSVSGAKPVEKKPESTPRIRLLVGMDRPDAATTTPIYVYDTVLDNCIRRLGEADLVLPSSGGNHLNRAEAIKAAKQETSRWVIALEVRSVYANAGKQVKHGTDELYVEYAVFEPQTGKIKLAGHTHQLIYQNGRGGVTSSSKNGAVFSEYSIKQAAIETADRILESFDIKLEDAPN